MKKKIYVYVLSRKGKPLMPTTRLGKVRKLLKSGKAVPVCNEPFTIRLKYDTEDIVQDLYFGQDTGRENIGVAVSNEKGECVFRANIETNNKQIRKEMDNRRGYRDARRLHKRQAKQRKALRDKQDMKHGEGDILRHKKPCKSIEFKAGEAEKPRRAKAIKPAEPQINNRQREDGWLTPSGRALVQAHLSIYLEIAKFLPITNIGIEFVRFDFQKMQNANIQNWQYSKGPLYGFKSYKEYIDSEQHGHCIFCDQPNAEYHHIIPKSKGGTDRISNIIGVCRHHHENAHNDEEWEKKTFELKDKNLGGYKVSLLNSCMTQILDEFEKLGNPVSVTYGYETSDRRDKFGIEKDHCNDAYMVSLGSRTPTEISLSQKYEIKHFKKKSGNVINALGKREYYFQGKCVAVNRHKAMDQKTDSLEEYMAKYADTHTKKQCARHFHELTISPAKRIYTFHKYKGTRTSFHVGDTILYRKKNKIKGNTKQRIFTAVGIQVKEEKIRHGDGDKTKKLKFCSFLKGGAYAFFQP